MAIKKLDTAELQAGQTQEFIVPATGSIDRSDFKEQFEIQDTPRFDEKAKHLAFYEEEVEVFINPGNQNDPQTIQTCVNGINQFFIRGVKQWVKRKFVAILAQAKTEVISTVGCEDHNGNRATKIQKTYVPTYPFTVVNDKNPDGHVWLERMMREA